MLILFKKVCLLVLLLILCELSLADEALIEADVIFHDRVTNVIHASGNVIIKYQLKKLKADIVKYNLNSKLIQAEGNVILNNEVKESIYADFIRIDDKLDSGYIKNLRANFGKDNIIYAKEASKNFQFYELKNSFYTSCKICNTNIPEWRIEAKKAVYDNSVKRMFYENGKLYLKNVPIVFVPYLTHATNINEKKMGFLFPKYKSSNQGAITIPFYIPIKENQEIIYKPTFFKGKGILNSFEYNHLTDIGEYSIDLSLIKKPKLLKEKRKIEHFLKMDGKFNLAQTIAAGFYIEDTSDITFRDKYFFKEKSDYLTRNIYINYFNKLDYLTIDLASFQDLKGFKRDSEIPKVMPLIEWHKEYNLNGYGKHFLDINYLKLVKNDEKENDRIIFVWRFLKNHQLDSGSIFDYSTKFRTDLYKNKNPNETKKSLRRFFSEAAIKWRYPLIRSYKESNLILEPIIKLSLNAGKNYNDKVQREDGESYELAHYNLFANSRYDGIDKVDHYSKFTYGLHSSMIKNDKELSMMLGQMYYLKHTPFVKNEYKLTKISDYLIKLDYNWLKVLDFKYKAKFDYKSLKNTSTESSLCFHIKNWKIYSSFASFKDKHLDKAKFYKVGSTKFFGEKIIVTAETAFSASSKLKDDSGIKIIYYKLNTRYISDCSNLKLEIKREYPKNLLRDKKPNTKVSFEFKLKNLN